MKLRYCRQLATFVVLLVGFLNTSAVSQTVIDIYVDGSETTNGDGSITTPYNNLDSGIADAEQYLGQQLGQNRPIIHVAEGVYTVDVLENALDNRSATFRIFRYLELLGGYPEGDFNSGRDTEQYPTILSGEIGIAGVNDNAYHVLHLWSTMQTQGLAQRRTTIDGFNITAGNASGSDDNSIGGGALIYPEHTTPPDPRFIDCKFIENRADGAGGAVASTAAPSVFFRRCQFIDNATDGEGHDSHIGGGAISVTEGDLQMAECRFEGNTSGSSGGAIASRTTQAVLCQFFDNEAAETGGAIYLDFPSHLENCVFAGNEALGDDDAGGAIFADDEADPGIVLCTIVHNSAPNGVAGGVWASDAEVSNSILWANTDSGSANHGPQITGMSCLSVNDTIQNFVCPSPCSGCGGKNILTFNPQFIDIDGADNNASTVLDNNYRLRMQSPSADSGDDALIPADNLDVNEGLENPAELLPWDLDREDRVFGGISTGTVDRGAFEMPCDVTYHPADCVTTASFAPPPDGTVDAAVLHSCSASGERIPDRARTR